MQVKQGIHGMCERVTLINVSFSPSIFADWQSLKSPLPTSLSTRAEVTVRAS